MKLIKDLGMLYATNNSKYKRRFGLYECPLCTTPFKSMTGNIKNGNTTKCRSCYDKNRGVKHGGCGTRLYNIWKGINKRCYNENATEYHLYGKKGVTVCDEWRNNFEPFRDWALENGYDDNLSIDKDQICIKLNISPSLYSPETCQWTDRSTQARATAKLRETNTSGYRGVSFHKKTKKYMAKICVNNKDIHLGYYSSAIKGAKAYDDFVINNSLKHTINRV